MPLNHKPTIPQFPQVIQKLIGIIPQQSTKLQSNAHLGSGLLGASVAGIEQDENGNLTFDPAKFALGFLGGAAGSKGVSIIYNNKSAQRHAKRAISFITDKYEPLMKNNPIMFAKIMNEFKPRDFLKDKKGLDTLSSEIFNKKLAQAIESALQNGKVEVMPKAEFESFNEFKGRFETTKGGKGIIKTPYKDIRVSIPYAWKHFRENTYNTNRDDIKGGFFETFRNPLFIVEQTRETQNNPSVYFYKPFFDKDKNVMNLFGIGVDSSGTINFKTYYLDEKKNRLKEILKSDKIKIVYMKK